VAVEVIGEAGRPARSVRAGKRIEIAIEVEAQIDGEFPCTFVVVLFSGDGRILCWHCSEITTLRLTAGQGMRYSLEYAPVLLGNGNYFFSAAIYRELDLRHLSKARFYDLLSRSFEFRVHDELQDDPSLFHHPATWRRIS